MQNRVFEFRPFDMIRWIAEGMSGSSSVEPMTAVEQSGCSRLLRNVRLRDLCVLALIVVSMLVVLTVPSPVSAQKLPAFLSEKEQTSAQGTVAQASLPATDEEIDKAVARIESRLAGLRKELTAAVEATDAEKGGLLTAQPEDLRKRPRLLSDLVNTLDR